MKSFQQIAQAAYTAMANEIEKADGTAPKPWPLLHPVVQAAWVTTVQAVVAELESIH